MGWSQLPPVDFVQHPQGQFLRGRRIGLDPGHGGDRDVGKQVEARANLAVALELKRFLERDGAEVYLTRDSDVAVPLHERAPMLVDRGAEVLVSLHHNSAESEKANYTSTWYHRSVDREPANLDLARAIQRRVMEALRTPASVPTPVLNDDLMYKRVGFAVLRTATIPAVLCEASFYTNPEEAERLEDETYRSREAYGYYLGLVDYFAAGTPRAKLRDVRQIGAGSAPRWRIRVFLDDGLKQRGGWGAEQHRVLASSISCRVGGRSFPYRYDRRDSLLTLELEEVDFASAMEIRFVNLYKQSNFPTRFRWSRGDATIRGASADLALEPAYGPK